MINEKSLKQMISQIKEPSIRRQLENSLGGKIVKQIRCLSKTCKGRIVANIYHDGQVVEVTTYNIKKELISGAISSRQRLDGELGFQCACGCMDAWLCPACRTLPHRGPSRRMVRE